MPLKDRLYEDPKGYFQVLIPRDWEAHDFPNDPRGKALFVGQDPMTNLRLIAKPSEMTSFQDLQSRLKSIEQQIMKDTHITEVTIGKRPALIRDVVMGESRVLMVDMLRDGIWHNLRYETAAESFTVYLPDIMECVNTYITLSPSDPAMESLDHAAWSAYYLAGRSMRENDTASARFFVDRGLSFDPKNPSLLELEARIETEVEP
jgi:hypothetical protein